MDKMPHNPYNPQNPQENVLKKDDVNIYLLILLCGQPAVIGLATSVDPALRTASSDRASY